MWRVSKPISKLNFISTITEFQLKIKFQQSIFCFPHNSIIKYIWAIYPYNFTLCNNATNQTPSLYLPTIYIYIYTNSRRSMLLWMPEIKFTHFANHSPNVYAIRRCSSVKSGNMQAFPVADICKYIYRSMSTHPGQHNYECGLNAFDYFVHWQ